MSTGAYEACFRYGLLTLGRRHAKHVAAFPGRHAIADSPVRTNYQVPRLTSPVVSFEKRPKDLHAGG